MNDDSLDATAALEVLDELVDRSAESLVRLRKERDVLRAEVDALEARVAQLEDRPRPATDRDDRLGRLTAERSAIRERLRGLLRRLEEAGYVE